MDDEFVIVEYDEKKYDTGKATLFIVEDDEVWIPNSLIDDIWEDDNQVLVARWFAEKECLV